MHNSILSITSKGNSTLGTGFVIDSNNEGSFVATCGHVVNNCGESITINCLEATVISNFYSSGVDLAVLYVKGLELDPLLVNPNKQSKKATVIGYTKLGGDPKRESIENISLKNDILIEKINKNIDSIKLTPLEPITNGYSGSPVICENTKMVIGIVNIQLGSDVNYAICAKHLLDIYPSINVKKKSVEDIIYKKNKIISNLSDSDKAVITYELQQDFEKALQAFSTQIPVWVEPQLYFKEEANDFHDKKKYKVEIQDIISKPRNIVIYSRQQYGSTCLSYYLVKKAWEADEPSVWLYLDINQLKPKNIKSSIKKKLKKLNLIIEDVECLVIDELVDTTRNSGIISEELSTVFVNTPFVIMKKTTGNSLFKKEEKANFNRRSENIYLWSLPRFVIRKLVSQYNDKQFIENENKVVNKIISDLKVINIPRTPQNCLTLLKISETNFDNSPVNRAEMIHRVLTLLFNFDHIPNYKSKPDLKDTEHILGYFCSRMLISKVYYFTRNSFNESLRVYCELNEIDVDVDVIFDVLCNNNILIEQEEQFHFKFSFWVFYFAAHRMLHNKDFRDYVLKDCNYLSYPEVIEFYSGIDRQRDDLLEALIKDLTCIKENVIDKCGLPEEFNIFDHSKWLPSDKQVSEMTEQISAGVLDSNLPTEVKDNFADIGYDSEKPLNQGITTILDEYSVLRLMKCINASAKALRNSSYVDVKLKHRILNEILFSWNELSKVLISIAPLLTENRRATVEGASFRLLGDFGDNSNEIFHTILQTIPSNINNWFGDDVYSEKIGTMLIKRAEVEENKLSKHLLNLIIIHKRPSGWEHYMRSYLHNEDKNSFYLMDIYNNLAHLYEYSFASGKSLKNMKEMIKISLAKHMYGNEKKVGKVNDSRIPKRIEKEL